MCSIKTIKNPGFLITPGFLQNHHTVAKGVEAVFLFYGLQIRLVNKILSGEGGRHTQGGRVREVEVSNQAVNGLKLVAGVNE